MEWVIGGLIFLVVVLLALMAWLAYQNADALKSYKLFMENDVQAYEHRLDILIREMQDFKLTVERNSDASKVGSERISVFGNQLDAAFKYHKDEVTDLLDRLQAKSLSELVGVQKMRTSPEELAKAKLIAEQQQKKREDGNAFLQQQKRLKSQQQEAIG